eukprot:gene9746-11971_t
MTSTKEGNNKTDDPDPDEETFVKEIIKFTRLLIEEFNNNNKKKNFLKNVLMNPIDDVITFNDILLSSSISILNKDKVNNNNNNSGINNHQHNNNNNNNRTELQFNLSNFHSFINDNILTILFKEFSESIYSLDLSKCKHFSIERLTDLINSLGNLRSLKIRFCKQLTSENLALLLQSTSGNHHLTSLDLSYNCFENLLNHCKCPQLSTEIMVNSNITSLTVMHSHLDDQFSGVQLIEFLIENNRNLVFLDLSYNQLSHNCITKLGNLLRLERGNLRSLNLSTNRIDDQCAGLLADAIMENNKLRVLDLSCNQIQDNGGKRLVEALNCNYALESLNLGSNDLGPETGEQFGRTLQNNNTLKNLYLEKTSIGNEGGVEIGMALSKNRSIQELDISGNRLDDESGIAIGESLKENSTLKTLILKRNQIGDHSCKVIGDALKSNSGLVYLDLSGNQIGTKGAKSFAYALPLNQTLKELDISTNLLGDQGGKLIGESLGANKSLTKLNLSANRLGIETCKALSISLKNAHNQTSHSNNFYNTNNTFNTFNQNTIPGDKQQSKQILNIQQQIQHQHNNNNNPEIENNILEIEKNNSTTTTTTTTTSLTHTEKNSNILRNKRVPFLTTSSPNIQYYKTGESSLSKLTWLKLDCNRVADEGSKYLATVIANNPSIQSISLINNHIGDVGSQAIAEALKTNTHLQSIQLDSNAIGVVGAKAISEALRRNTTLKCLGLSSNRVGDEGARQIKDSLDQNTTIQSILINNNYFCDEVKSIIESSPKFSEDLYTCITTLSSSFSLVAGGTIYALQGLTFIDTNRNTKYDSGEPGFPGIKIYPNNATTATGKPLSPTTTGQAGEYEFDGLLEDTNYEFVFKNPAGYYFEDYDKTLRCDNCIKDIPPNTGFIATKLIQGTDAFNVPLIKNDSATAGTSILTLKLFINSPPTPSPTEPPMTTATTASYTTASSSTDYGGTQGPAVGISGMGFSDGNSNGVKDSNEGGVQGMMVYILDSVSGRPLIGLNGQPIGSQSTKSTGYWSIGNMKPNTQFNIIYSNPPNYVFGNLTVNNVCDNCMHSPNDNEKPIDALYVQTFPSYYVPLIYKEGTPAGSQNMSIPSYITHPGSLTGSATTGAPPTQPPAKDPTFGVAMNGFFFYDQNNDGLYTTGEGGVGQGKAQLYEGTNSSPYGFSRQQITPNPVNSGNGGDFGFDDLIPGRTYKIKLYNPPNFAFRANYTPNYSCDNCVRPVDPSEGLKAKYIFSLPAWQIPTIYFDGLPAGSQTIDLDIHIPSNIDSRFTPAPTHSPLPPSATTGGVSSGTSPEFGGTTKPPVGVSGIAYLDHNNNGVQDSGEPGVEGLNIYIYDPTTGQAPIGANGRPVDSPVKSKPNGVWSIGNIRPNTPFKLNFTNPANYVFGKVNANNKCNNCLHPPTADEKPIDAEVVQTFESYKIPLIYSQGMVCCATWVILPSYVTYPGPLTGSATGGPPTPPPSKPPTFGVALDGLFFNDSNSDGVPSSGEVGIPGGKAQLIELPNNPSPTGFTRQPIQPNPVISGNNGTFLFDDLIPGNSYRIRLYNPPNYIFTNYTPNYSCNRCVRPVSPSDGLKAKYIFSLPAWKVPVTYYPGLAGGEQTWDIDIPIPPNIDHDFTPAPSPTPQSSGTTGGVSSGSSPEYGGTSQPPVGASGNGFQDDNNNGIQDPNERGVPGMKVYVLDPATGQTPNGANGRPVDSPTTSKPNSGIWAIGNLKPNTPYTLIYSNPPDYVFGKPNTNNICNGCIHAPTNDEKPIDAKYVQTFPSYKVPLIYKPGTPGGSQNVSLPTYITYPGTLTGGATGNPTQPPAKDPTFGVAAGGMFFDDTNKDGIFNNNEKGIAGGKAQLVEAPNNPNPNGFSRTPISPNPVTTTSDGVFIFDDLIPGKTYKIRLFNPPNYAFTNYTPNYSCNKCVRPVEASDKLKAKYIFTLPAWLVPLQSFPGLPAGSQEWNIDITVPINIDQDFVPKYTGTAIQGQLFVDKSGNGFKDTNEPWYAGATVNLLDSNKKPALDASGKPVPPSKSDQNGKVTFENIPPGTYYFSLTPPSPGVFNPGFVGPIKIGPGGVPSRPSVPDDHVLSPTISNVGYYGLFPADDSSLSGSVFYDTNFDNKFTPPGDKPIPGITVNVYSPVYGYLLGTAVTGADGKWTINGLYPGFNYRIDFVVPPGMVSTGSTPSKFVTGGMGDIFFGLIFANRTGIDVGPNYPTGFVTTCFVKGANNGPYRDMTAVISFSSQAFGKGYTPEGERYISKLATHGQVGAVNGIAFVPETQDVFLSAYQKAGCDYGPYGTGAIYRINNKLGITLYTNLNVLYGQNYAGPYVHSFDYNEKDLAGAAVGKTSFGEMTATNRYLYVTNLARNDVVQIPLYATPAISNIVAVNVPNPGCSVAADWHIFPVTIYQEDLYTGGVCSGEGGSPLSTYILRYNRVKKLWIPVLAYTMNYARGCRYLDNFGNCVGSLWTKWSTADTAQPMLSSIIFDDLGHLIMSFKDRSGDIGSTVSAPDMLVACLSATGYYFLENNGYCGGFLGSSPYQKSLTGPYYGPGGGQYFDVKRPGVHDYVASFAAAKAGNQMIISTGFDYYETFEGSLRWYNTTTGRVLKGFSVYISVSSKAPTFGKQNGLGDIASIYSSYFNEYDAGRIWFDYNSNGIQDANEPGVTNITVYLISAQNPQFPIAQSVSDRYGYFFFAVQPAREYACLIQASEISKTYGQFYLSPLLNDPRLEVIDSDAVMVNNTLVAKFTSSSYGGFYFTHCHFGIIRPGQNGKNKLQGTIFDYQNPWDETIQDEQDDFYENKKEFHSIEDEKW